MNENIYTNLVRAEKTHSAAQSSVDKANSDIATINDRLAEKAQERAQIVGDSQAGTVDEQTAALRFAIIEADARDLSAMLSEAQTRAAAAEIDLTEADRQVRFEKHRVDGLERHEQAQAAEAVVRNLEAKLVGALKEWMRASGRTDNSWFALYHANKDLKIILNAAKSL